MTDRARSLLPAAPRQTGVQTERIRSALTATEFTALDQRAALFVITAGSGRLASGASTVPLAAPCLVWSPPQKGAPIRLDAGTRGFVLRVSDTVVGQSIPGGTISAHVRKAVSGRIHLPALNAATLAKLENLAEQIDGELFSMAPGARAVVHHCVSLLLIEVWRASSPTGLELDTLPQQIADEFLHLAEVYLQSHWSVSRYAERIGVSRDRLNSAVRRAIGTTPHSHLQARLMEEAKSLLLRSNLHVAEIAFKLGFTDAAYFNRFFQRHAEMAPGKFRQLNSSIRRRGPRETAFHAWP
ncbi:helix-turn-helix domain-containing protein [Poseidonocella sedimentorum]|uniref:Transcriptional regulator, AraC family n=1 Tax=Poseidonocella sedimentorum TaxID=871652 RepID=A0A1I6DTS3_9RHOB|nr:helix-turn-helix domain-containing protein [Poseidonocella sedimentorum]SFR08708.1 transcriptional regulator, AraC family [Poseidonocella sedimentorum]